MSVVEGIADFEFGRLDVGFLPKHITGSYRSLLNPGFWTTFSYQLTNTYNLFVVENFSVWPVRSQVIGVIPGKREPVFDVNLAPFG